MKNTPPLPEPQINFTTEERNFQKAIVISVLAQTIAESDASPEIVAFATMIAETAQEIIKLHQERE